MPRAVLWLLLARCSLGKKFKSGAACPPSCSHNELSELLDQHCSDKGTFFMGRHHYSTAYHSLFGAMRGAVESMLEIGIGEDTAPSIAAWSYCARSDPDPRTSGLRDSPPSRNL